MSMTRTLPKATFTPIDDNPNCLEIGDQLADMIRDVFVDEAPKGVQIVLDITSDVFFETDWTLDLSWTMTVRAGTTEIWSDDVGVTSNRVTSVNPTSVVKFIDWCEFVGQLHTDLASYR